MSTLNETQQAFLVELADLMQKYNVAIKARLTESGDYTTVDFQQAHALQDRPEFKTIQLGRTHATPYELYLISGMTSDEANEKIGYGDES